MYFKTYFCRKKIYLDKSEWLLQPLVYLVGVFISILTVVFKSTGMDNMQLQPLLLEKIKDIDIY